MNRYEALKHVVKAHGRQVDKCGQPYILHPLAVAEVFDRSTATYLFPLGPELTEDAVVVALLHDVLEDTDYDLPLADLGVYQQDALLRLTRPERLGYREYIEGVCLNDLAGTVKLADLWHNLQPERAAALPSQERMRLRERYLAAREQIWEALGYEWWPEALEGSK